MRIIEFDQRKWSVEMRTVQEPSTREPYPGKRLVFRLAEESASDPAEFDYEFTDPETHRYNTSVESFPTESLQARLKELVAEQRKEQAGEH